MKRYNELTEKQVLALTQEGIQQLIDLECAYEGVQMLPVKPTPFKMDLPEKDVTVYSIGCYNTLSNDEAKQIQDLLVSLKLVSLKYDYSRSGGYDYKYVSENEDSNSISSKKYYSKTKYDLIKVELDSKDAKQAIYDKALDEYNKLYNEREEIATAVNEVVSKARNRQYNIERYIGIFENYMQLASEDNVIAYNFLKSAYPDVQNYPEIVALGKTIDEKEEV